MKCGDYVWIKSISREGEIVSGYMEKGVDFGDKDIVFYCLLISYVLE